ncbi:hypothetical protein B0J14DRAFT_641844 [Halenospora varia]|nr:hypothetical protein B0J14DRAFT_641844 [Halenospora varia]
MTSIQLKLATQADYLRLASTIRCDSWPPSGKIHKYRRGNGPDANNFSHPKPQDPQRIQNLSHQMIQATPTYAPPRESFDLVAPNDQSENEVRLSQSVSQNSAGPEEIVLQKDSKAIFCDLNHVEFCFPMVTQTYAEAFLGLPPTALRPKAPEVTLPSRAAGVSRPISITSARWRTVNPAQDGEYGALYEVSSDTESQLLQSSR